MKVTINASNRALEKQKKTSFAFHIAKDIKHDNKENQCIASKLKFKFDTFENQPDKNFLSLSQRRNMKQFKLLKQKCKMSETKQIKQNITQIYPVKPIYAQSQGAHEKSKHSNNPEFLYEDKLISSINELKFGKAAESSHSTKANSRQKSRTSSLQTAVNCCKIVRTQREEAYIKVVQKQRTVYEPEVKKKQKQKKISKIMSPQITKITRIIMLDWLFQLSAQIQLPKQALYNAIDYIDKYVMESEVKKSNYQKLGLACLFLATKLQMSSHPQINTFLQAMDNQLDKDVLIETQRKIVNTLKFRLNPPTLFQYMNLALLTLRTFKSEYKNIGWLNDLPIIEKEDKIWKKMFWILDGVTMQGVMVHKYGKSDICLSIMYSAIQVEALLQKTVAEHHERSSLLMEKMKLESTNHSDFSFTQIEKSSLNCSQEDEQRIQLSYECFFRYATTSNRSLKDLDSCLEDLKRWKINHCNCQEEQFEYHEQLKHIALIK